MAFYTPNKIVRGCSGTGDALVQRESGSRIIRGSSSSGDPVSFAKAQCILPRVNPFFKFAPAHSEGRESIGIGMLFVRDEGKGRYGTHMSTMFISKPGSERYETNKASLTNPTRPFYSLEDQSSPLDSPDFRLPARKTKVNLGKLREKMEMAMSDNVHRVNVIIFRGQVTNFGKPPEGVLIVADKFSQEAAARIAKAGSEVLETRFVTPTIARSQMMDLVYKRIEKQ